MSTFQLGQLAQIVHVTDDLPGAVGLYQSVFGGECYYEGYSQFERRDAALFAIGDFVIEPMAPSKEVGADKMPVGRFLARFGSHLHSIAINVKGVPELYEHLLDHSIRVVGPGGSDPSEMPDGGVTSIYTHPKDTHCLIEFVDFGPPLMEGCPRLNSNWNPAKWQHEHPLGIIGPSHVTVVVRDVEKATHTFEDVLGCHVFHEEPDTSGGRLSRYLLLGSEVIVELAQPIRKDDRAARDLALNGEMLHSLTFRVADLDAAESYLAENLVEVIDRTETMIVLDPQACFGALIIMTDAPLPGDPR